MKIYPPNSTVTVRDRIERAYVQRRKNDIWVSVHNNGTSVGEIFGFFLDDWESPHDDFRSYEELGFRLDTETRSAKVLSLGINYQRKEPKYE